MNPDLPRPSPFDIGISRETFLQNPAFQRFARGFETYQRLLLEAASYNDIVQIQTRMSAVYEPSNTETNAQNQEALEITRLIRAATSACDQGQFSRDGLAYEFSVSPVASAFLKEWNRDNNEVESNGMVHVSDLVAYRQEHEGDISLHLRPVGVLNVELIDKIKEGFQIIASKLSSGELSAERVTMKSWLLNDKNTELAKKVLGDISTVEDLDSEDEGVLAIQHMALFYNGKSLENYLLTGEKPEVKQMILMREEFMQRFLSVTSE